MTGLPITSLFVALFCIALVALSVPVSLLRAKAAGSVDEEVLRRRVRAQGNFIEYVPLALLALALLEFSGNEDATLLWTFGGVLAAGRFLHALGMLANIRIAVALGALATYLTVIGLGICLFIATQT